MSLAQEHVADLGQEFLSAVTIGVRLPVHQRNAERRGLRVAYTRAILIRDPA